MSERSWKPKVSLVSILQKSSKTLNERVKWVFKDLIRPSAQSRSSTSFRLWCFTRTRHGPAGKHQRMAAWTEPKRGFGWCWTSRGNSTLNISQTVRAPLDHGGKARCRQWNARTAEGRRKREPARNKALLTTFVQTEELESPQNGWY